MALYAACFVAAFAVIGGIIGAQKRRDTLLQAADHALVWVCALLAVATMGLTFALVDGDLSLRYVAEHITLNLPRGYKAAALWSGDAGRRLLFAFILAALMALALASVRTSRWQTPVAAAVVFLALGWSLLGRPFARLPWQATEGNGLAPALQSLDAIAMAPVALTALALLVVAGGVLLDRKRPDRVARWLLLAWLGETLTLALGAHVLDRTDAAIWSPITAYGMIGMWLLTVVLLRYPHVRARWRPTDRRAHLALVTVLMLGGVLVAAGAAGRRAIQRHTLSLGQGQSANVTDRLGREWTISQQGVSAFRSGNRDVEAVTLEATRGDAAGLLLVAERSQFLDSRGEELGAPVSTTARAHGALQSLRVAIAQLAPNETARMEVEFVPLAVWLWIGCALLLAGGAAAWLISLRRA